MEVLSDAGGKSRLIGQDTSPVIYNSTCRYAPLELQARSQCTQILAREEHSVVTDVTEKYVVH